MYHEQQGILKYHQTVMGEEDRAFGCRFDVVENLAVVGIDDVSERHAWSDTASCWMSIILRKGSRNGFSTAGPTARKPTKTSISSWQKRETVSTTAITCISDLAVTAAT